LSLPPEKRPIAEQLPRARGRILEHARSSARSKQSIEDVRKNIASLAKKRDSSKELVRLCQDREATIEASVLQQKLLRLFAVFFTTREVS